MKNILISGGCGFVGRNMVRRLAQDPANRILFIDDLSVGDHPDEWLAEEKIAEKAKKTKNLSLRPWVIKRDWDGKRRILKRISIL